MKSTRSKTAISVLFLIAMVVGFSLSAYAASPSDIIGTWALVGLSHENDGEWGSVVGKMVFNSDGTGMNKYDSNYGGIPDHAEFPFTYTITTNQDGSITFTINSVEGEDTFKFVLSDNRNMFIADGTSYITDGVLKKTEQMMLLGIRMDTTKTCSNADLKGEYYFIGYEYNASGGTLGYRRAWSGILNADGNGNYSKVSTLNGDGTVKNLTRSGTYTVSKDCSIKWTGGMGKGYLNGEGKLAVAANPSSAN